MRTSTPLLSKTPFAIDPVPLRGASSSRAGLASVSRVLRSLVLPGQAEANLPIKIRDNGFSSGQYVECVTLLHAAGGDCMEDMQLLREDEGLAKILGYQPPSPRAVGDFLDLFHDADRVTQARQQAQEQQQLAILPSESTLLEGLGRVLSGSVQAVERNQPPSRRWNQATVDLDATIVESHKQTATVAYEGTTGYQPMVAVWAEADLILADQFRDGNVPAIMQPLTCARAAFAALPASVRQYRFRGDSACHENNLLEWLGNPQREGGPKGFIGFAVSARQSEALAAALRAVKDQEWKTFGKEADGTLRQWAEVEFVPGQKKEKKDTRPLRYVGLRLLKPQGVLFGDGTDRHFHAVLTNLEWKAPRLLKWHREKAGTVEHVHEELKNGLGGGRMPSQKFGANAAWFRMSCIAYNILSALRQAWPEEELQQAKLKRLRFKIFNVSGRVVRDRRKIRLRLAASEKWIGHLQRLFVLFPLVDRPTG